MNNVNFEIINDGRTLRIHLTRQGDDKIIWARINDRNVDSDGFFEELIETQLCNGWELVNPEDVGALTDALLLSNDGGKTIYSNINWYQLVSPVEKMIGSDRYVDFQRAE